MRFTAVLASVALSALGCAATVPPPGNERHPCRLGAPARLIAVEAPIPGELHEVHDLPEGPHWWAPAPPLREAVAFAAEVRARLGAGAEQRALLQRMSRQFAGQPGASLDDHNVRALLTGAAGRVRATSCLEALLFIRQSRRYSMLTHPTEFSAFLLRKGAALRLYVSGADRAGLKMREEVLGAIDADVEAGFALVGHLHNHNFFFSRRVGDRLFTTPATLVQVNGVVAPSATDVHLYRALRGRPMNLRDALVTNGLVTGVFGAADIDRLAAPPPTP